MTETNTDHDAIDMLDVHSVNLGSKVLRPRSTDHAVDRADS